MKRYDVLSSLINEQGFKNVAEIGVQDGTTTSRLLSQCHGLEKLYAVDLWQEAPDNPAGDKYVGWNHKRSEQRVTALAADDCRLSIIKKDSVEAAGLVPDSSLDLVFIDAEHSVYGAFDDITAWWPKVREFGVVAGHDFDWPSVRYVTSGMFTAPRLYDDNVWMVDKRGGLPEWKPEEWIAEIFDSVTCALYQNGLLRKGR